MYNWCSGCKIILGNVSYQIWDLGRWNSGILKWKTHCQADFWTVVKPKIGHRTAKLSHRFSELFFQFGSAKIRPRMLQFGPQFSVRPIWKTFAFFALFYFELAFGVNMKVLDNFVRFPMALVWRENDFWFLSYDENTPRRS